MHRVFDKIRSARLKKGILIREMAAQLQIDPSVLSKIERGQRPLTKEIITKISTLEMLGKNDFLVLWYENQVEQIIGDTTEGTKALMNILSRRK